VQFQRLIISGELPCSKEEAATLAGIQLRLEEAWPDRDLDQFIDENDKGHMTSTAVPSIVQHGPVNVEDDNRERETLLQPDNNGPSSTSTLGRRQKTVAATIASAIQPSTTTAFVLQNRKSKMTTSRRHGRLTTARSSGSGGCIDGEDGVRSCFRLPDGAMVKCLPPEYRSSRAVRELIEVGVTFLKTRLLS